MLYLASFLAPTPPPSLCPLPFPQLARRPIVKRNSHRLKAKRGQDGKISKSDISSPSNFRCVSFSSLPI